MHQLAVHKRLSANQLYIVSTVHRLQLDTIANWTRLQLDMVPIGFPLQPNSKRWNYEQAFIQSAMTGKAVLPLQKNASQCLR